MAHASIAESIPLPKTSPAFRRATARPGTRYERLLDIALRDGLTEIAPVLANWIEAEARNRKGASA